MVTFVENGWYCLCLLICSWRLLTDVINPVSAPHTTHVKLERRQAASIELYMVGQHCPLCFPVVLHPLVHIH